MSHESERRRSGSVMMPGMVIDMEAARLHTLAQVKAFLDGAAEGAFRVPKTERHRFIERVRTRLGYARQGRAAPLSRTHDRAVTSAGDSVGATVPYGREALAPAPPTPARLPPPFHRHGRGPAGRHGCVA